MMDGPYDLAVVGAGVVGLAHAYDAALRGLRVLVLEREARATGASVRNFGHGVASGLAGTPQHAVALDARARWLALGEAAGFAVEPAGTLMVARHDDELAAMAELADTWPAGARLLTGQEARALAPVATDRLLGALHLPGDIRVDAERAAGAIAAHLQRDHGVRFAWATTVTGIAPGALHTAAGSVEADAVVVCPGAALGELGGGPDGLSLCSLQMLEVDPPHGRRYRPALMTGLSLLRYPAFAAMPATDRVRERLGRERPELLAHGVHLIVTQRPDGALVVGDTHADGPTAAVFRDEALDELLLEEAGRLLGAERLRVRRRWLGVYPTAPGDLVHVAAPLPGVRVVAVVSGVGMTTALGLAPRVLDDLLGGVDDPAPAALAPTGQAAAVDGPV